MIVNVILAILVLSVIIIVHEFGHFIVAKANGVTVLEFALGFGPKLIHFKKGETVYSIKLLPFGGSCMMLGDEFMEAQTDEDEDEQADEKDGKAKTLEEEYDADRAFSNKSVWSRIAIIAAGPLFYFLLAFSHCIAGIMRGAGKATVPMFVMLCCWCIIRVTYITITVRIFPVINTIFWAYPLTWTLSSILFFLYYRKADWIHGFEKK